MITGFNTDIEYEGTTYHVQTEDIGLDTPLILSLVYVGGAILASKRTPYDDLITKGFEEKALAERLQRQHKLICAAIRAGRIEDLKRMGERDAGAQTQAAADKSSRKKIKEQEPAAAAAEAVFETRIEERPTVKSPQIETPQVDTPPVEKSQVETPHVSVPVVEDRAEETPKVEDERTEEDAVQAQEKVPPSILHLVTDYAETFVPKAAEVRPVTTSAEDIIPPAEPISMRVEEPVEAQAPAADFYEYEQHQVPEDEGDELYLSLLDDEGDFRAGQLATIRIYVGRGKYGRRSVPLANVTVKVLGTTFRPMILSTQTDYDGVAVVRALLPHFTSGRAAIVIRASGVGGDVAELRRIIHQS